MLRRTKILVLAIVLCVVSLVLLSHNPNGEPLGVSDAFHTLPIEEACRVYFDDFMAKGQNGVPEATFKERVQAMRIYGSCVFSHPTMVSRNQELTAQARQKILPMMKSNVNINPNRYHQKDGIVIAVEDAMMAARAVAVVRTWQSKLPIEIVHWNPLSEEEKTAIKTASGKLKPTFRDAKSYLADDYVDSVTPWALNWLAIIFSEFSRVIFMEADTVALMRLDSLFQSSEFENTGTLLFRDRLIPNEYFSAKEQQIYTGLMPTLEELVAFRMKIDQSERKLFEHSALKNQVSGGLFMIDKRRHIVGLLIGLMMQIEPLTSDPVVGCKELMWIAQYIAGTEPVEFHEQYPGAVGSLVTDPEGSREVISTHLMHMNNDLDWMWMSGGMRACPFDSWDEDWENTPQLRTKFADKGALKKNYEVLIHPHHILVPPIEEEASWSSWQPWTRLPDEGCRGYIWRAKDSPARPGRMRKLGEEDVSDLDDVRRAWRNPTDPNK